MSSNKPSIDWDLVVWSFFVYLLAICTSIIVVCATIWAVRHLLSF